MFNLLCIFEAIEQDGIESLLVKGAGFVCSTDEKGKIAIVKEILLRLGESR